jgi:hypothetical protein
VEHREEIVSASWSLPRHRGRVREGAGIAADL